MKKLLLASLPATLLVVGGCSQTKLDSKASSEEVKAVVKNEAKEAQDSISGLTGATLKNSQLEGADSAGKPLWRLEAKIIRADASVSGNMDGGTPKSAILTDAKATLFRAGKPETVFKAKQILMFNTNNGVRLSMTQGVQADTQGALIGTKPVRLVAKRGDVDVNKKLVTLSGDVRAAQGNIKVQSQKLRSQTSLQKVELSEKVIATNEGGKVEAQSAIYDWKAGTLSAKSVVATQKDTTLRGENLQANTNASRGVLTGNVTATAPNGVANAPRVEFDWQRDRIFARSVTMKNSDGSMRAATLRTDSKLKVAEATNLSAQKDGATLSVDFASGFDSLSRVSGRGVSIVRSDMTLRANRVEATDWNKPSGVINATGNVRATSAKGNATAGSATFQNEKITARGGVVLTSDGNVLRGDSGQSDLKFQNATLNGGVRADLTDGSTLRARSVVKTGDKIVAVGGATGTFKTKGQLGNLQLTAPRLESDVTGQNAVASGGVTIKSATGATAKAERAIYNRAKSKVTATGGVVFNDPSRGLTQKGSSLVADLKLKEVVIDNVQGQGSGSLFEGKKLF